jgi:hypothetical protein
MKLKDATTFNTQWQRVSIDIAAFENKTLDYFEQ